jgi:Spy/CpxP family protein refolding chaperone
MRHVSILMLLCALCWSAASHADAALKSRLQLDNDQARQVEQIQAEQRKSFAAKRGEFNRESRALRRARLASDSAEIARLTAVTEALRSELRQMRDAEDASIAALLSPEQQVWFSDYQAERRQMAGSSRDERMFD